MVGSDWPGRAADVVGRDAVTEERVPSRPAESRSLLSILLLFSINVIN